MRLTYLLLPLMFWSALASAQAEETSLKSPVVYTCGVSVLQGLRRTTAVLGGL